MKQKVPAWMSVLIAIAGLALIGAVFLPIWRIELSAPQYPEGLMMQIYAGKLGGDVEIVNGLNHYIGMRRLEVNDFPEFTYLPFIIGGFGVFALLVAAFRRRKPLFILSGLYVLFAILALVDFWQWEYKYGHNLDPTAPIQVPGMTYQPPLIGYKQLLNFGAFSIPDLGGWLMALAGVLLVGCCFLAWRQGKKIGQQRGGHAAVAVSLLVLSLASCSSGPQPIQVGKDNCSYCKMGIADARFGAEVVSKKGKVWKFDDVHCLRLFLQDGNVKQEEVGGTYFVQYDGGNELLISDKALLLQSADLHSPMGSNIAAFSDAESLEKIRKGMDGNMLTWEELRKP